MEGQSAWGQAKRELRAVHLIVMGRITTKYWPALVLLLASVLVGTAFLLKDSVIPYSLRLTGMVIGLLLVVTLLLLLIWQKPGGVTEPHKRIFKGQPLKGKRVSPDQFEQLFEVLSQSQQNYRDLIDTFDDVLFLISPEGVFRAANRSVVELLGVSFPEIIGRRVEEFLKVDESEVLRQAVRQFTERGHWSGILRVRMKKTGAIRQFDCVVRAQKKDGQVVGAVGLARDVAHFRESEALFTELFETLREGVYFTTPDGRLLDTNPALVRMLGYESKEELLGVNVDDLFLDPQERASELFALEKSDSLEDREIVLQRKDGSQIICLDSATAIRDSSGQIVRYQGTLDDITRRKEMEKKLHQEQEFARRLVESFPDLIVVLDAGGRYTYVSSRIREALGFEPHELIGRKVGERTHPEDRAAIMEMFTDLLKGNRTFGTLEYRPQHKSGGWRIFRATAGPLYDAQGRIAGVIASSRDVTSLKRMEQQLVQTEKLAAMGQMMAGVAHELNNPLTAILGMSELLREKAVGDEPHRQLELVHRQAKRAAKIVQSLLAFSRPAVPRKVPVQLAEVVARTLQLHEHSLRSNQIRVEVQTVPSGLRTAEFPTVMGDPNQLMQVILNLTTNAEQAIREVRDHGTIRIRMGSEGNQVWISVQDDGVGISKEALPRIFDPFFTTKRPGRGTGLGLSICMAIVREHGGHLEVQPSPGTGSTFTITLPTSSKKGVEVGASHGDEDLRGGRSSAVEVGLEGRRVLVVDDEESIRDLVHDGLVSRGIAVDCASNLQEALTQATSKPFDAILCDVNLRDADGLQLIAELQRISRREPGDPAAALLIMTGDLLDAAKMESLKLDGLRVLEKPFQVSELVGAIREELTLRSATPRRN